MRRPLATPVTVAEIVARLGGEARGDHHRRIDRIAPLGSAGAGSIAFLASRRHAEAARQSGAAALILSSELIDVAPAGASLVLSADPYLYYARLAQWFESLLPTPSAAGVHPSASVSPAARLGAGVTIGAYAVIEAGAEIGDGCNIGAGCFVGAASRIGAASRLHARVTVHHDCTIGARAIVHSGTVIGADGFGFAPSPEGWVKIPQLGGVSIGDDCEIGANCAIDRGALDDTVIGHGCKIDNLVQIAHNVRIGDQTAIAGCAGIAGSAVIGRRCMIGGGAGILGHLEICDGVTVSAMSLVSRSIRTPGFYTGVFPLATNADWERIAASLKRLPALRRRVQALSNEDDPKEL